MEYIIIWADFLTMKSCQKMRLVEGVVREEKEKITTAQIKVGSQ